MPWHKPSGGSVAVVAFCMVLVVFSAKGFGESRADYRIVPAVGSGGPAGDSAFSLERLEYLFGARKMTSEYFDRAMDYRGSRFRAVSLKSLARHYGAGGKADALLLNCFDDYQGIVSLEEIGLYDLYLATAIELAPGTSRPDWLNPLLILVPDGIPAPRQERFMTANIRELRFVRLGEYYAPLSEAVRGAPGEDAGFLVFRDNCLSCHSLKGIGGNKGGRWLGRYDFSQPSGRRRFRSDFTAFHNKENPDKQNIEQFVTTQQLEDILTFLRNPRLLR